MTMARDENGGAGFEKIVVQGIPLIDVRAPVEFVSGAIPGAVNLPLLDDEQRHRIGTCHRENGPQQAIELGYQLISGDLKQRRLEAWCDFIQTCPAARLYCSRGGMRSKVASQWLYESTGIKVGRLRGGYKAFRNYLLEHLSPKLLSSRPVILGGRTGSGKTALLKKLENSIDLEALAHHRGSSFGHFISPQPGQADFENRLACALIKHEAGNFSHMILEDEGRHVGKRFLPKELSAYFASGGVVILETPLVQRIQNTFDEYVITAQMEYSLEYGEEEGLTQWYDALVGSMKRIGKRLGGSQIKQVGKLLEQAHRVQIQSGSAEQHKAWVELLLVDYYDPMYDYQIGKKSGSIVFSGAAGAVLSYLQTKNEPEHS